MPDISASQLASVNTSPRFSDGETLSSSSSPPLTASPSPPYSKGGQLFPHVPAKLPENLPAVPEGTIPNDVDDKDLGTPDAWIRRDPRLVRLTGKVRFSLRCRPDLHDTESTYHDL